MTLVLFTNTDRADTNWAVSAIEACEAARAALAARLKGPGGLYNLGNALTLMAGLALHSPASGEAPASAFGSLFDFFAGSMSALALTVASLVFFWSGELYHRAFAAGGAPDMAAKRLGDFLSGVGAMALGVGLLILGDPMMAAFAGALHAAGKFGSAFQKPGVSGSVWRLAVLVSRVPATWAALAGLSAGLSLALAGAGLATVAAPAAVLVSCLFWAKADLLLMRPA